MTETTLTLSAALDAALGLLREAVSGGNFLLVLKMFALLALGGFLLYLALFLFNYMARGPGLILLALAATMAFFWWAGEDEVHRWSGRDQMSGQGNYARRISWEQR